MPALRSHARRRPIPWCIRRTGSGLRRSGGRTPRMPVGSFLSPALAGRLAFWTMRLCRKVGAFYLPERRPRCFDGVGNGVVSTVCVLSLTFLPIIPDVGGFFQCGQVWFEEFGAFGLWWCGVGLQDDGLDLVDGDAQGLRGLFGLTPLVCQSSMICLMPVVTFMPLLLPVGRVVRVPSSRRTSGRRGACICGSPWPVTGR